MLILAIESSCDETSCAVVEDGRNVLSNITATQLDEHSLYGGVVPELASRLHCECISSVCESALSAAGVGKKDIDAIAVTFAPGLVGALLVGVNFAKGFALGANKPLIPVHHIKGHIASNYIAHKSLSPPYLAMVVSGGHTQIMKVDDYTRFTTIGRTIDDAAGEAFDKAARAMGLAYPGGIHIEKAALNGDSKKYKLPFPKTANKYDFSFSGLKTATLNLIHNAKQKKVELDIPSLAASFQHTVCEILSEKFVNAAREHGYKTLALSGGVAANSLLREKIAAHGLEFYYPPLSLCGDNAAMIGCQGYYEYLNGTVGDMTLNAVANQQL
ncbi:MAG: tRNA (adenosine(37)-N6)-threonylcarbamoyltransferase complex transferase subunit TsaD [Oscillospiraceae bacterium]|nr:tRNA (adenosine(37)-N6)-threonylcarbamoyltransferase complex transferase subunit TsaD [Oscillospiraceae bacterium]